jgi:hypothetical protein
MNKVHIHPSRVNWYNSLKSTPGIKLDTCVLDSSLDKNTILQERDGEIVDTFKFSDRHNLEDILKDEKNV